MPADPYDRPPPTLGPMPPLPPGTRRPASAAPGSNQGGPHYGSPPPGPPRGAPYPPHRMPPPQVPPPPPEFRGPRVMYRPPDAPESGGRLGSIVLFSLLALVLLVAAASGTLIFAPPTGLIRDRLIAEVKSRTGRDLTIGGSSTLTLFPSFGVTLRDVALSAPPTMPGPPLLVAESLEVQVELLPLITRQVSIEKLALLKPVIDLRVDGTGRRSWDFAEAETLRQPWPQRYAQAVPRDSRPSDQAGRPVPKELQDFARNTGERIARAQALGPLNDLSLGHVRITEGTVRYADARQGRRVELASVDAHLSLRRLAGPLDVAGSFLQAGERIAVEVHVDSFKDVLEEQPTKVSLKIGSRPLSASYEGNAAGGLVSALDGQISLKAPSLDGLAQLLGVPLSGADLLGAVEIGGQLKINGTAMALSGANLALGSSSATGRFEIDASGARPRIKANLRFAALDLNQLSGAGPTFAPVQPMAQPIMPPPSAPTSPPPAGSAGRFAPPPQTSAPAKSIEELIDQSSEPGGGVATGTQSQTKGPAKAPQVRGFTKRSGDGWSSEAIELAPLRMADVEGRLDFDRIAAGNLKIGATVSTVQLKNGILKLDITEVQLYGGKAKGLINLDAREPEMALGVNLSGDGLQTLALLRDAGGMESLDGRGRMIIAVSARGGSERELIGTLAGRADIHLTNGNVIGWDAGQMLSGLGQGRLPKLERQAQAKTPFSELSATFQIANGVARNQDLKFESAVLRSTGSGVINLVDRNIDVMLKPKQAAAAVGGLSFDVPVRVAGPWDKVSVIPELGSALKSPQAQEAVKKLKDGDVDGAIKSVIGDGPKAEEKINKAKGLLKQFLKP